MVPLIWSMMSITLVTMCHSSQVILISSANEPPCSAAIRVLKLILWFGSLGATPSLSLLLMVAPIGALAAIWTQHLDSLDLGLIDLQDSSPGTSGT